MCGTGGSLEYAGFKALDEAAWQQLAEALTQLSNSAVSLDDLAKQAELWLFEHQYVLPGDRALRDAARVAFAVQEQRALQVIRDGVPERQLRAALSRLFSKRRGPTGATVLEWLRTPPGKHGQFGARTSLA